MNKNIQLDASEIWRYYLPITKQQENRAMKKVILKFKKKTEKFGIEVEESLEFVSKDRAEDYISRLGAKIWDTEITEV